MDLVKTREPYFILFFPSSNLLYTVYSYAETPTVVVVRFGFKFLGCFFDLAGSLNVLIRSLAIEGTVGRSVGRSVGHWQFTAECGPLAPAPHDTMD